MNLYLDFDGVIADTISVTYKKIEELGIDLKDVDKVSKFYRELDWFYLLSTVGQINNSIHHIKKIVKDGTYNIYILTTVNSLDEVKAKSEYIRSFGLKLPIISVPKGVNKCDMVPANSNLLVDDYSGNLYLWEKAGGIGVKFSLKPSNEFLSISSLGELNSLPFMQRLIRRI